MSEARNDDHGGLSPEAMQTLYAKTLYRLRESRKALLKQYGVSEESQLLERIRLGETGEHPGYEHYLGALILEQGRLQLREEMLGQFRGAPIGALPAVSLHLLFQERLEATYSGRLSEPPRLALDALLVAFDTGLMMEVRAFSSEEFSFHWSWGEAELRCDTAPVHAELEDFPCHVHLDDGRIVAGPAGIIGVEPWTAFCRLVDILLADPLLERV